MAKDKLKKFEEITQFKNVFQPKREELFDDYKLKGSWGKSVFDNENPIVLELGCGKGEYTVNLAQRFPDKNFIGIDIKGARMWRGAKTSLQNEINNVAFIRAQVELIEFLFAENEISEIWITFPDPQIKFRRTKHRLTHPVFLKKYSKILKSNGIIHLKTDSEFLHGYTHGILQMGNHNVLISNHNIYKAHTHSVPSFVKEIQTHYEKIFLDIGKMITYLQFQLNEKSF